MKKCLCILLAALMFLGIALPSHSEAAAAYSGQNIVTIAKKYLGVPYLYGGTTTSGFDCSGYTQYVFNEAGITIKRTAAEQYTQGTAVQLANLQAGDLVFFSSNGNTITHVGIFTGDNSFISSTTSKGVSIASMDNTYWKPKYVGAKRISGDNASSATGTFPDVLSSHFAYSAIEDLSASGIIKGFTDGLFRPDEKITRGQAAAIINRVLQYKPKNMLSFKDVSTSQTFAADIAAMKELGIINGYEDGTYRPGESLTRTQMAVIVARAFNLKPIANSSVAYSDVSKNYWAYSYIVSMKEYDLTTGFQTSAYNGNKAATRCYFAAAVYNAINK